MSLLTVFHNTGTKGLFKENEGGRDLKQMRVNARCTIMSTPGFLLLVDVKVLYRSHPVPVALFNKEIKRDNTTCSRSSSSQSGKYPPPVCSGFWLKSNHFCATGLSAPGQNDTKNSVAWTVCMEKQYTALGICKKEFSSLCFCSDLSDARG